LQLPSAGPAATADSILEVATAAERLGFDSVWMFDHLFTPVGLESKYPYTGSGDYPMSPDHPFFDPIGLFGVLAASTERVRMGTGVMIPTYRHPIVLAKILATIENFAPGRLVLGAGAGWMREEFEAVGVPFERRGARFEEYIAALRTLWSGDNVSFSGDFYSWDEGGFLPSPTQPIPVIVGGHGDRALRRAARIGDGWAVVTAPGQGAGLDGVASRVETLRSYLDEEGRSADGYQLLWQHALWLSDHPNPKLPLTGPPDVVAGSIKRLEEIGITTIDMMVVGPPQVIIEMANRFCDEVLPLL
jgi:probable F420-dependent oxidoreductase